MDTTVDVISNADASKYYVFIKTPTLDVRYKPKVVYDPLTRKVCITGSAVPMFRLLHKVCPEAPLDYKVWLRQSTAEAMNRSIVVPEHVPAFNPDTMAAHVFLEHGVVMLEVDPYVNKMEVPLTCVALDKA